METGTVKSWNDSGGGWGMISLDDDYKEYSEAFVTFANINEQKSLKVGDKVSFEIEEGVGGIVAVNVKKTK